MAVKSSELSTPERGMSVETRAQERGEFARLAALQAMEERLQKAKITRPKDLAPHCGDCFRRGVEAALRAVEGLE